MLLPYLSNFTTNTEPAPQFLSMVLAEGQNDAACFCSGCHTLLPRGQGGVSTTLNDYMSAQAPADSEAPDATW